MGILYHWLLLQSTHIGKPHTPPPASSSPTSLPLRFQRSLVSRRQEGIWLPLTAFRRQFGHALPLASVLEVLQRYVFAQGEEEVKYIHFELDYRLPLDKASLLLAPILISYQ